MRIPQTKVIRRQARTLVARALVMAALAAVSSSVAAQTVPTADENAALEATIAAAAVEQSTVGPPATLTYANRPIVQLRASILGRLSGERAAAARVTLDRLVDEGITGPVQARDVGAVASLEVAGRRIVAILPADVDPLIGETPASVAAVAAQRLQVALNEVAELRRPQQLLVGGLQALLATLIAVAISVLLRKGRRSASRRIVATAERRLQAARIGNAEFVR